MKRIIGFVVFSIALSVSAQERMTVTTEAPQVLAGRSGTLDQLLNKSGIRPESVINETSNNNIVLLPVAINSPGQLGTFFKTDATIVNHRQQVQEVAIAWLPLGVAGTGGDNNGNINPSPNLQFFTLAANTAYQLPDYLASGTGRLGESGVGSVIIFGIITNTYTIDNSATIDASFRIWTFQPGSSGTVSFTVDGTGGGTKGATRGTALGLRQDAGFRTNIGIVNLDSISHTWSVLARGQTGDIMVSVTVPANSMIQTALPAGTVGLMYIEFDAEPGNYRWTAYGVTADNITGDAWLARAAQ